MQQIPHWFGLEELALVAAACCLGLVLALVVDARRRRRAPRTRHPAWEMDESLAPTAHTRLRLPTDQRGDVVQKLKRDPPAPVAPPPAPHSQARGFTFAEGSGYDREPDPQRRIRLPLVAPPTSGDRSTTDRPPTFRPLGVDSK